MKLTTLAVALAAAFLFAQSAQARGHHHRHLYNMVREGNGGTAQAGFFPGFFSAGSGAETHLGGRPAAWCGWEMRQLVGGDPGPSFNLARNWAHWGHSGPAGVGAVVVWPHHVGKIVGQENGQWIIESGNDGHALRTRARSVSGAIAFRWG